jgi:hypothetical protein
VAWTCAVVNAETIRVNVTRGSFIIDAATTRDEGQRARQSRVGFGRQDGTCYETRC